MNKATSTPQCPNVAFGDGHGLSMNPHRARKFAEAMWRVSNAVHSLQVAANTFPRLGPSDGCMEPATTVSVFSQAIDHDMQILFRMLENEDVADAEREAENG